MFRLILVLFVMLILAGGSIAVIKSITQRNQSSKPDYNNIARLERELFNPAPAMMIDNDIIEYDMSGRRISDVNAARAEYFKQKKIASAYEAYVQSVVRPDGFVDKYYTWTDPKTGATMGRREIVYAPLDRHGPGTQREMVEGSVKLPKIPTKKTGLLPRA